MHIEKVVGVGRQAVYVFNFPSQYRADGDYPCKIGHTTTGDVRKRLMQYQAGMQEPPRVGLVIMCDDSQSLEALLHNQLADKRIAAYGTEWFMTTPEEALAVARTMFVSSGPLTVSYVGRMIRAARIRGGLSQADLARRNNTSQRWISEIENGKETAQTGMVLGVLCDLGIPLSHAKKHVQMDHELEGEDLSEGPPSPRM